MGGGDGAVGLWTAAFNFLVGLGEAAKRGTYPWGLSLAPACGGVGSNGSVPLSGGRVTSAEKSARAKTLARAPTQNFLAHLMAHLLRV